MRRQRRRAGAGGPARHPERRARARRRSAAGPSSARPSPSARRSAPPRRARRARRAGGARRRRWSAALALTPGGRRRPRVDRRRDRRRRGGRAPRLRSLPARRLGPGRVDRRGLGPARRRLDAPPRRLRRTRRGRRTACSSASAEGRELFALDPAGQRPLGRPRRRTINSLDWSTDEGFRVAYVAGRELRVVTGDGSRPDELVWPSRSARRAVAWRPGIRFRRLRDPRAHLRRRRQSGRDSSTPTPGRSSGAPSPFRLRSRVAASGRPTASGSWSRRTASRSLVDAPAATRSSRARSQPAQARPRSRRRRARSPSSVPTAAARPSWCSSRRASPRAGNASSTRPAPGKGGAALRHARLLSRRRVDPAALARGGPVALRPHRGPPSRAAVADISRQLDADARAPRRSRDVAGWCC